MPSPSKDVLERLNATVPDSWEDLLQLLARHKNASAAGASAALPPYGLCVTNAATCGRLGDLLSAIAASVVQIGGAPGAQLTRGPARHAGNLPT